MTLISFLIICPLNFLAGLVDSIGGGGGLISLPAFMLAGLSPHAAVATNKLASTTGTTVSTVRYCKNGYYAKKLALPGILLALCGSFLGARLVLHTDDVILKRMMLFILPVVAVIVLLDKKKPEYDSSFPASYRMLIVCISAFLIGIYDGFYGPGTGTFLLLALTKAARMDIRTASGNVKLINLASNVAALVTFLFSGYVHITYGIAGAIFCLLGHYIGSGLVMKNGSKIVRPVIVLVLLLLFAKIISGN
ncbi:MAG: sulfite exporter TauE/SafE family protein [Lachnospiraceae bacterium]|nr:sulfite exporter TauE/SafE family protein [Lachnospiraceae bacterium]